MSDFKDKERLDALRERLYARGEAGAPAVRPALTPRTPAEISRGWVGVVAPPIQKPSPVVVAPSAMVSGDVAPATTTPPRRRYRAIILLSSLVIFMAAVGISSLYLFFGGNQISGRNIDISVAGPNAVAGGDVLEFSTTITNKNDVAMEGVTLIVSYPTGSRATGSESRLLQQERVPIENIAPGETRTVPLAAVVFGEENENKQVAVSVDYRVTGSNATFFKEASPLAFAINSSPVVVRVEAVDKISPGQEFDVRVIVESNAEAALSNVLLSATYPEGFRLVRATPEPAQRQSTWRIDELAPGGRTEFILRGIASGLTEESGLIRFEAGTPRTDDPLAIGSLLAQTTYTFTVEAPFVAVGLRVADDADGSVVVPAGEQTEVLLTVTNTHTATLYDMNVRIKLGGPAFRASQLRVNNGVYDATTAEVRFEVSGMSELARVAPGERREFRFTIGGSEELSTASLDIDASVYARRVSESNVPEELIGAAESAVRYASVPTVGRQIDRLAGPIPPVVGQETMYTLTIEAAAGANDLSGALVVTSLPQHVRWLNTYDGPGTVTFNPTSKELRWNVGEVKGKERALLDVQVALTPSVLQLGSTPVMMNRLELTGTDRFTGSPVQASAPPITTELSSEAGYGEDSGAVKDSE